MFPVEKPSLLNDTLNEDTMAQIVESTGKRLWEKFMTFGTASAGIIAILIILQVIKMAIDIIINGFMLHRVYGWSIHMVGAVWDSLTQCLIQLGGEKLNLRQQNDTKPQIQHRAILHQTLKEPRGKIKKNVLLQRVTAGFEWSSVAMVLFWFFSIKTRSPLQQINLQFTNTEYIHKLMYLESVNNARIKAAQSNCKKLRE